MTTAKASPKSVTRYAALLRGVNVNGITIRSADLKALFAELGFGAVRTVLASGNVLFDAAGSAAALKKQIEGALRERFGYDAWIVLAPQSDLAKSAKAYPFGRDDEAHHPYVVFSADAAVLRELLRDAGSTDSGIERVAPGDGVLYWQCPRGASTDTPVAKLLAKPRYKSSITTRNLRTVEKLVEG
jgi:uncharacterized protein (DUF1697 family)